VFVVGSALGGGLYGFLTSLIPSPSEPNVFWVGNFASPWLALAFISGWPPRSRRWAAAAGVVCDIAGVVGFYGHFLFIDQYPGPRGQERAVLARVADNLNGWLSFIAPWVMVAFVAGAAFGLIGRWWEHSRSVLAGSVLGVAFLAEPWIWRFGRGYDHGSWVPWVGETAVGVAILLWVARLSRARLNSAPSEAAE
jgi:hypothetical protein